MNLVLAAVGVLFILAVAEWLWRRRLLKSEASRKFVHILTGVFVAFWPLFLNMRQIQLMSALFLACVLVSVIFVIFGSIHSVERRTWGEVLYPVGIGLSAFLSPSPMVFTIAILHLAVADGLAAVIGTRYGKSNSFKVLGERKSVAGLMTFIAVSYVVLFVFGASGVTYLLLPITGAIIENLAPRGTDNIFVPLLVVAFLRWL